MPERTEPRVAWAAPGAASGTVGAEPSAVAPLVDRGSAGPSGGAPAAHGTFPEGAAPSTGVAVARGDARRPGGAVAVAEPTSVHDRDRTRTAEDPAAALDGNPLRGLGVAGAGGVLDGSFDLLRFRFRRFLALTAVLFVPVQLIDLLVALSSGTTAGGDGTAQFQIVDAGGSGTSAWAILVLALEACALFLLGMAAGHLVQGWLAGRDDPFGTVVGAVARRAWVVPIVVLVAVVAKSAAACFGGVGFFLVDALFFIAGPVAGAERTGPFGTIGRSVRLSRGAYGLALAVCFGGFAITFVLRFALSLGPMALVALLGLPDQWAIVLEQASALTLLITMPLTACIAARAHVDLRCRVEGLDLVRREEARGLRP
ncbi:hypothetical protein [Dermatobacter hominis]|uniref:hypothetical protein n=1 Tax=Dermatobacter hominis TaxID=2884263 RepID=UPI001D113BC7|nr:hypothetical protein [Dermatobacter hominis]UDY37143.1 hypothetical protein LH044_06290 [Dermatobacter hominis]